MDTKEIYKSSSHGRQGQEHNHRDGKTSGAKQIIIELASQRLRAIENGKEVFAFSCVTGDASHPTPRGEFRIIGKEKTHYSHAYHAQMNYALQLTRDGIYIHEGYNYVADPAEQSVPATILSDTATAAVSYARALFPDIAKLNVKYMKDVNLTGSHGCIRLAHTFAVKLFDWAEKGTEADVR